MAEVRELAIPSPAGEIPARLYRPAADGPLPVVVYLHGYGAYLPFAWHLRWMDHLLEKGSIVLFPRYQPGLDDPFHEADAQSLRRVDAGAGEDQLERLALAEVGRGPDLADRGGARS